MRFEGSKNIWQTWTHFYINDLQTSQNDHLSSEDYGLCKKECQRRCPLQWLHVSLHCVFLTSNFINWVGVVIPKIFPQWNCTLRSKNNNKFCFRKRLVARILETKFRICEELWYILKTQVISKISDGARFINLGSLATTAINAAGDLLYWSLLITWQYGQLRFPLIVLQRRWPWKLWTSNLNSLPHRSAQ